MQWYNEPASFEESDGTITVTTKPKQDFWRTTRHDFIADNGHFYYQEVTGNFVASVKIIAAYKDQYDQAGLMLRLDELTWIKCGIELLDGVQQASAVVTREFSDWSVVPLNDNPEHIWLHLERIGSAVEVYYSRNGEDYTMIRQAYLTETKTLQIGVMTCSPTGDGFTVTFEDFQVAQSN